MHGTGTPLGDPIEVGAAAAVYLAAAGRQSLMSLVALKSDMGHAEPAAGVYECVREHAPAAFRNGHLT